MGVFDALFNAPELLTPNKKPLNEANLRLKNKKQFYGYWLNKRNLAGLRNHGIMSGDAQNRNNHYHFNGSGRLDCGLINVASATQFTLTSVIFMDGSGTDEHTIASNWDNAGVAAGLLFRIDPSASNQLEAFVLGEANNTVGVNLTDLTLTANRWHICTMRFNSIDGSGVTGFLDNKKSIYSIATSTALDATATVNNFYIGDSPHTTLDGLTGGARLTQFRNIALTDSEILALHRDLYRDLESSVQTNLAITAAPNAFQAAWATRRSRMIGAR